MDPERDNALLKMLSAIPYHIWCLQMKVVDETLEWGGSNLDVLETGSCVICTGRYYEFGYNSEPFYNGQCCTNCYETRIKPMRETSVITAYLGPTAILEGEALLRRAAERSAERAAEQESADEASQSPRSSPDRVTRVTSPLYSPGTPSSLIYDIGSAPQALASDLLLRSQSRVLSHSTPRPFRSSCLTSPPRIQRVERAPIAAGSPIAHPIFSINTDLTEVQSLRQELQLAHEQVAKSNKALAEALVELDAVKRRRTTE